LAEIDSAFELEITTPIVPDDDDEEWAKPGLTMMEVIGLTRARSLCIKSFLLKEHFLSKVCFPNPEELYLDVEETRTPPERNTVHATT